MNILSAVVRDVINKVKIDDASGMDVFTKDLLQGGGETIDKAIHALFFTNIQQEKDIHVPEDWKHSTIVPLYKRKGYPHSAGLAKLQRN